MNHNTGLNAPHRDDSKHHLGHIKRVPPVVVSDIAVVLLDAEQPATQHLVLYVEPPNQVQVQEHPQTGLLGGEQRDVDFYGFLSREGMEHVL